MTLIPWICPKCESKNLGVLPMEPPGVKCTFCEYVYYIGKTLDEEVRILAREFHPSGNGDRPANIEFLSDPNLFGEPTAEDLK